MTDRVKTLTVVLDQDVRIDDIQGLIQAIYQFKGVAHVEPGIVDSADVIARMGIKNELTIGLIEFAKEFTNNKK